VVNVDNGYGAGVHAARIARRARPRDDARPREAAHQDEAHQDDA
jgi:hypothetical protein